MRCIFDLFIRGKKVGVLHLTQHVDSNGSHESIKDMKSRILREIHDVKSEYVTLIRRMDIENKLATPIDKA